jgi:NAD(P)-dependent dehydrogenase (short-subunit alcohol dehydrogenase family)
MRPPGGGDGVNPLQRNGSRRYRVRVNAVSPSSARHKFLDKTTSAEPLDRLAAREAFGCAAEPWEVVAAIALLASDYSSCLTGEAISVSSQHPDRVVAQHPTRAMIRETGG